MATPITRPADLMRVTSQFSLQQGGVQAEIAECDVWYQWTEGATPTDWDAALLALATENYNGWAANMSPAWFPPSVLYGTSKAARCDDVGHVLNEQSFTPTSDIWGGASGNSLPWQISCCVGLYGYQPDTFIANARRKRGRIYLPPMQTTDLHDPDTGEMLPALNIDFMHGVREWLVAVAGGTYPAGPPTLVPQAVILSLGPYTTAGTPGVTPVTWVRTDNIWDTQRRRRKSLKPVVQFEILA